jgi:iron complex outermembrane recepter protein
MSLSKHFLLVTATLIAGPVVAQTSPPTAPETVPAKAPTNPPTATASKTTDTTQLEVIVVTARKVGERLQDVPLSISALSGQDLELRGIKSITDLSLFTPGLSYSPDFGRTAERPVIRGISALRPEAPQPVSVFVNGVFVRDGALSMLLDDAARVEVIKGPQSALYGRSTYAGAINYVTQQPGNELTGKLNATVAGNGERSLFGAITVPMSDMFSARLRAKSFEYGGQYTNSQTGNKIGDERTRSGGGELSFRPTTNFDVLASIDYAVDRDGLFAATVRPVPTQAGGVVTALNGTSNIPNGAACNGRTLNIVGNNPATGLPDPNIVAALSTRLNGWPCGEARFTGTTVRRNEADLADYTDPRTGTNYGNIAGLDRDILRGSLTLNYTFGNGSTLTSQSAYTRQNTNIGADQSYNGTRFAPGFGAPASSWLTYDRDKLKYYSQELRLASSQEAALTWLAGVFFYKEETEGVTTGVIAQNATFQTIADFLRPKSQSNVRNFAPFGRVQYAFNNQFKVSLEGRYNEERVQVGGTPLGTARVTVGTCTAGEVCFVNGAKTFKDFSPRFTVDYKPNKDMLLYAQVAKGSKSGGFNTTPGLTADVFAYNGENVNSVEVGVKNEFAQRRVRLNFAMFQNNISDLQLSNLATVVNPFTGASATTTIVNNVGKARTRGFEADLMVRPAPWLTMSGTYAFTDAKAIEGTEITNGTAFGGNRSVAGATLPRSPTHSATASVGVDVPVGAAGLYAFGRVDLLYQSRRFAEIQNLIWANAFTHINANIGLRNRDWRLTLFVKNLTDDDTSLNGFRYLDPSTFRRTAVDFLPKLRQYGITLAYDF